MPSGVELGYAERTSDFTTTSATFVDVTSLSVTVDVGARPIVIEFFCPALSSSAVNGGAIVGIAEDGTSLGAVVGSLVNVAASFGQVGRRRRSPSAGSHTYKVQLLRTLSGTAQISAGVGGTTVNVPAYIQVMEV